MSKRRKRRVKLPDGKQVDVKWAAGPTFAEVAEALAIPTSQIMGTVEKEGTFLVMYDDGDDARRPRVFVQSLRRDADGIFVKFRGATELPGYWESLEKAIGQKLEGLEDQKLEGSDDDDD